MTAVKVDNVSVFYDLGLLRFDNQIEIDGYGYEPFSDGGDSGALVVDNDQLAVGLHFSSSGQGGTNDKGLSYANPITVALDKLNADLVW